MCLGHAHALSGLVAGTAVGLYSAHLPLSGLARPSPPQLALLAGLVAGAAVLPDTAWPGSPRPRGWPSATAARPAGRPDFRLLPGSLAFTTGTWPELWVLDPALSGGLGYLLYRAVLLGVFKLPQS